MMGVRDWGNCRATLDYCCSPPRCGCFIPSIQSGWTTRNASYLQKYTGVTSYAVVAGIDVLQDAQAEIDAGNALLYRIPARELQSE